MTHFGKLGLLDLGFTYLESHIQKPIWGLERMWLK